MAKVSVMTLEKAPMIASADGVQIRSYFERESDPIHMRLHTLAPQAAASFSGVPSDRLVYVWRGSAMAGGVRVGPRSTVIAEYGSSVQIDALNGGAELIE